MSDLAVSYESRQLGLLDAAEARALTDRIRDHAEALWSLLLEAEMLALRIEMNEHTATFLPRGDPYAAACRRSAMRDRAALAALDTREGVPA